MCMLLRKHWTKKSQPHSFKVKKKDNDNKINEYKNLHFIKLSLVIFFIPLVDRTLLHFLCPMEASGHSQRWKMHVPEFKHSRRCQSSKDCERDKTRDKEGLHKSVTMAPPNSRYLTDRQYVKRKPLFSAEQHASILKKTYPTSQDNTEKVRRTESECLFRVQYLS